MAEPTEVEDHIVASIRRIVRAIDVHSRRLVEEHGLTIPQLYTLQETARLGGAATGTLARAVHLSQPTVSGILDRLERQGLIRRERSAHDRRTVVVRITPEGEQALRSAPSLLQTRFRERLARLEAWERHWMLAALQRIAAMMDAGEIDAAPVLETGALRPSDSGPAAAPADGAGERPPADEDAGDATAEERPPSRARGPRSGS